jgi:curved DNA-binding protein CbpA
MEHDFKTDIKENLRHKKLAYRILGLEEGASSDEVRNAYHYLALRTHPDKNPKDKSLSGKFININNAYEYLTKGTGELVDEEDIQSIPKHSKYDLKNKWGYYNWWRDNYTDTGIF